MKQSQYNNIATIQVRNKKKTSQLLLSSFADFCINVFPIIEFEVVCVMPAVPTQP